MNLETDAVSDRNSNHANQYSFLEKPFHLLTPEEKLAERELFLSSGRSSKRKKHKPVCSFNKPPVPQRVPSGRPLPKSTSGVYLPSSDPVPSFKSTPPQPKARKNICHEDPRKQQETIVPRKTRIRKAFLTDGSLSMVSEGTVTAFDGFTYEVTYDDPDYEIEYLTEKEIRDCFIESEEDLRLPRLDTSDNSWGSIDLDARSVGSGINLLAGILYDHEFLSGERRQAKVEVVRALALPCVGVFGTCSTYVKVKLGEQSHTTEVRQFTDAPQWNTEFALEISQLDIERTPGIVFEVWNHNLFGSDKSVGEVVLKWALANGEVQTLALSDAAAEGNPELLVCCSITEAKEEAGKECSRIVQLEESPTGDSSSTSLQQDQFDQFCGTEPIQEKAFSLDISHPCAVVTWLHPPAHNNVLPSFSRVSGMPYLLCVVECGENISDSPRNLYLILHFGLLKEQTAVARNTSNPIWNQVFLLDSLDDQHREEQLDFDLYLVDSSERHRVLGTASLQLSKVTNGELISLDMHINSSTPEQAITQRKAQLKVRVFSAVSQEHSIKMKNFLVQRMGRKQLLSTVQKPALSMIKDDDIQLRNNAATKIQHEAIRFLLRQVLWRLVQKEAETDSPYNRYKGFLVKRGNQDNASRPLPRTGSAPQGKQLTFARAQPEFQHLKEIKLSYDDSQMKALSNGIVPNSQNRAFGRRGRRTDRKDMHSDFKLQMSSIHIQRIFRGFLVRKILTECWTKANTIIIQRVARGFLTRQRLKNGRELFNAAVKIQALVRGAVHRSKFAFYSKASNEALDQLFLADSNIKRLYISNRKILYKIYTCYTTFPEPEMTKAAVVQFAQDFGFFQRLCSKTSLDALLGVGVDVDLTVSFEQFVKLLVQTAIYFGQNIPNSSGAPGQMKNEISRSKGDCLGAGFRLSLLLQYMDGTNGKRKCGETIKKHGKGPLSLFFYLESEGLVSEETAQTFQFSFGNEMKHLQSPRKHHRPNSSQGNSSIPCQDQPLFRANSMKKPQLSIKSKSLPKGNIAVPKCASPNCFGANSDSPRISRPDQTFSQSSRMKPPSTLKLKSKSPSKGSVPTPKRISASCTSEKSESPRRAKVTKSFEALICTNQQEFEQQNIVTPFLRSIEELENSPEGTPEKESRIPLGNRSRLSKNGKGPNEKPPVNRQIGPRTSFGEPERPLLPKDSGDSKHRKVKSVDRKAAPKCNPSSGPELGHPSKTKRTHSYSDAKKPKPIIQDPNFTSQCASTGEVTSTKEKASKRGLEFGAKGLSGRTISKPSHVSQASPVLGNGKSGKKPSMATTVPTTRLSVLGDV